ncbi:AAA family ATPase, partial [Intestinimonas aquisgranensis]|nr:AAA family ATPase [Intestinimonas aquisgranensis]
MIIKKMTATFGKLEGAVLELKEGLNVLQLPNEGGKSTWCAFLRAMFYGIPTRERDTRTTLAEKNRYAPWSGSPMAGEVLLTWHGRDIVLRRFAKGAAPFGGFEAVDAATGETVPGLTGENCGEVLLGVSREVWQRSAFVGQSGLGVDADPELERRIAALVSSGEEDVSFSETEQTLKSWLNRRKHNKTGLIPQLEEELSALEGARSAAVQNQRRLREAQVQSQALEKRKEELEAERDAQRARRDWAVLEQYSAAVKELRKAQEALSALEGEHLPSREALRKAQGDLTYYNTLALSIKEAKGQRETVRAQVEAAGAAAGGPRFPG